MPRPGTAREVRRSPWERADDIDIDGIVEKVWQRRVGDGLLLAFVGLEPEGWHMSLSFRDHRGNLTRYPRWDEIADARYELLPAELTFAMILPPPSEYVALHDTTFHLHELR